MLGMFLPIVFDILMFKQNSIMRNGVKVKATITERYREMSSTSNTPDFHIRLFYFAQN